MQRRATHSTQLVVSPHRDGGRGEPPILSGWSSVYTGTATQRRAAFPLTQTGLLILTFLAILELALYTRLASNSSPSAGIKSIYYHHPVH